MVYIVILHIQVSFGGGGGGGYIHNIHVQSSPVVDRKSCLNQMF